MKEKLLELLSEVQDYQKKMWMKNENVNISVYTQVTTGVLFCEIYVHIYENGKFSASKSFLLSELCSADENCAQMAEFNKYVSPYLI